MNVKREISGNTPLHLVLHGDTHPMMRVEKWRIEKILTMAKMLITHGADIFAKNEKQKTCLDLLLENNFMTNEKKNEFIDWLNENYPEKILEHMSTQFGVTM